MSFSVEGRGDSNGPSDWANVLRTDDAPRRAGADAPALEKIDVATEKDVVRATVVAADRATALAVCRSLLASVTDRAREGRSSRLRSLDDERDRLVRAIAELDRSLAVLPFAPSALGPAEALVAARVRKLAVATGAAAVRGEGLAIVAALRRLGERAAHEAAELRAEGRGDLHPDVVAAVAREEALRGRTDAQLAIEQHAAEDEIAALDRPDAKKDRSSVARFVATRLPALRLDAVASGDPAPLRILAVAFAEVAADEAALATRYGEKHPMRVAAAARRERLQRDFEAEKALLAQDLAVAIATKTAPSESDPRSSALRDRAAELAAVLARTEALRDASDSPSIAVVVPCHVR